MEECFCFVLNEHRVQVNKRKLWNKSRYFASLFSHNFNDSDNKEHVINYDIALCTLQNFVDWIHDENCSEMLCHFIKTSLAKFMRDNFVELLNILELSVLFMVDELTNDATDILVLRWLLPERIIDVWLLAQELSLKTLEDVCLSVCLDRFEELPVASIVDLSKDNVVRLIGNVNVRSSIEHLNFIRNEWIKFHQSSDSIMNIKEERQPKFVQGTIVYKAHEHAGRIAYLYTWDGRALTECAQVKDVHFSRKCLIGAQIASRGFSVYMVGGEMGLGTGQFNDIIWRYCLLSKRWYYQAKLPIQRRHMVVVFLKNKLIVVGGVGRHRLKLCTVDILNIHTGSWEKGANVPESFTDVPPHCVLNGKLFLLKSFVYIYCVERNDWQTVIISNGPVVQKVDAFLTRGTTLFSTGESWESEGNRLGGTIVSRLSVVKDSVCEKKECSKQDAEHGTLIDTSIVFKSDWYHLRYVHVDDIGIMILNVRRDEEYRYLHLHREIKKDFENLLIPKLVCFNFMSPDTLHDLA
ncbi:unnamed protein product [Xylocopa violacea]|uniref:BTB domain-containing protein n=1 Tax=Xylocopa violacea TaxID=135666 RepID=A0ABP1N8D3_XYLVO